MYEESDLLAISALQHLSFCERQCALIHLEGVWAENRLTVEGRHLHDRAHERETESRGNLRVVRGLRLRSLWLGLFGIADVVEFQRVVDVPECRVSRQGQAPPGARLPGVAGLWQPMPVEYKRGKPKLGPHDEVQLCAQALCLEEMFEVTIPSAALYYGEPRQRTQVLLTPAVRQQTEQLAARLQEFIRAGKTPAVRYEKKCDNCSLLHLCMPKTTGARKSVPRYLDHMMDAARVREERSPL